MRKLANLITTAALVSCVSTNPTTEEMVNTTPFEPTWESLTQYEVPEWWKIEVGIYFHWGPYSVPGYKSGIRTICIEMAVTQDDVYHDLVFGGAEKFGYKDFIPLFTGEKFNADEWAALFKEAGHSSQGHVLSMPRLCYVGYRPYSLERKGYGTKGRCCRRDASGEESRDEVYYHLPPSVALCLVPIGTVVRYGDPQYGISMAHMLLRIFQCGRSGEL